MLDKFKLGHWTSEKKGTGVSVILAEEGAVGGVSVRGSAPATRETDLLRAGKSVDKVNAIVLSGGSAFGLEADCGVVKYLAERNIGFATGAGRVPIVCGASIYDLEYKENSYPDIDAGYKACENAKPLTNESGAIGGGTGATVGKALGIECSDKSGFGSAYVKIGDLEICAVVVVNAFGNIYDYKTGKMVAGVNISGNQIDIVDGIMSGFTPGQFNGNTTIGCIITNAKINREQANKLADICHDGYAMTIRPVHTMVDGDAVFALSSCEAEFDFMTLSCIAPTVMADAILNAAKNAKC